jgi:Tol biopolymer transport system component
MAKMSTDRNEPILAPGARSSRRHRPSGGLALLIVLGLYGTSMAGPAAGADLISVGIRGVSGNGASSGVAMNSDGSVVAFYSDATDLVPGDTNERRDVFVRDANATPPTERVSVSSSGTQANGNSQGMGMAPALSDNGQIVAFYSDANNLVENDLNSAADVFVRDREAGNTELISMNLSGTSGNGPSRFPSMSADGQLVAFQSAASDLVPDDTNGAMDIFVRDRQSGTTERVCGVQPNASSSSPAISADGNFVAFVSAATNLVSTQLNGKKNVFVCDRTTGTIELISVNTAGVPGNGDSLVPAISGDGNIVAFKSEADNLVPHDNNGVVDVFARDRAAGTTERVSVSFNGGDANDGSFLPVVSRDGRFVVFGSAATNLVLHDFNNASHVFIRDRQTGVTLLVDVASDGSLANAGTPDVAPAISADGNHIGFVSFASNLAPNDKNGQADVFTTANPFALTPTVTPTRTATATITPTPIACIGTQDCPSGKVCFNNFCVVPTSTPTPVPCINNSDCPAGLVCLGRICQPPVSPTPTTTPTPIPTCSQTSDCDKTCSTAADCHEGQDCVSLKCSPADRCVDGVCAPTRQCGASSGTTCIATRETCLNDTCECGGDCNLDGFVFADEIAKMICILSGSEQCPLSECEAGDFDRNGHIMGNEVCQAVTNLGTGCPLGIPNAAAAHPAIQSTEPRTLSLTGPPAPVFRGQTITIQVNLSGPVGVADVATAQLDMLFDPLVLSLTDPATACTVNSRLIATDASFNFAPRRPDTPTNEERLRTFVAQLAVCAQPELPFNSDSAFSAGAVLTCSFRVNPTAPLGQSMVAGERTNLGDIHGNEIPSIATSTDIMVVQQPCGEGSVCEDGLLCRNGVCEPPCTGDSQCLDGDVCRTGACVPKCTVDSECSNGQVCRNSFCVPTCTQDSECSGLELVCKNGACVPPCTTFADCPVGSSCVDGGCETTKCNISTDCRPDLRQACVGNACLCAGDCNGDSEITSQDIIIMNNILRGTAPLSQCLAFDPAGAGEVGSQDILLVLKNLREGCP